MRNPGTWRWTMSLALAASIMFAAGCAQDVGDIDRTQADKIKKSEFLTDDEWHYRQTVVETDIQGSVIFAALESSLKRIRWEVTETVLFAYSTVELAEGQNAIHDDPETRRLGAVAAFPITGHFDIQRQYNPSTGEPTNVISENTSDRVWYDRDYMRVDWSTNLIDGFWMVDSWLGSMSAAKNRQPIDSKDVNPFRARIGDEYIDVVTEYNYEPDIYACYGAFGLDTIFSCEGGRVRTRHSFVKIDPVKTYEPLNFTDNTFITDENGKKILTNSVYDNGLLMEVECDEQTEDWMERRYGRFADSACRPATYDMFTRFGYFRTERIVWDEQRGGIDDNRRYYANRWNIWRTMLDENEETLPMSQRIPKPITYHLNLEYPAFLFDAAQVVADEWDIVFRNAVKVAQGISDAELDAVLEDWYGHNKMFRIVENSCHPGPLAAWKAGPDGKDLDGDRKSVNGIFRAAGLDLTGEALESALWDMPNKSRTQLCAELEFATETRSDVERRFDWERFGDLRYSFFNWVESDVPWAGYGPSAADPLTGELISGNANFAGIYIRQAATYAADLVQYFNGDLSEDDIRHGYHVTEYLRDRRAAAQPLNIEGKRELAYRSGRTPERVSPTNFESRVQVEDLPEFIHEHGLKRTLQEGHRMSKAVGQAKAMDTRRIEFLEQPAVKHKLINSVETMTAMEAIAFDRFGPGAENDPDAMHQAYLELFAPELTAQRYQARDRFLSERNIMTYEALERSAESLVTYDGVADFFKGKSHDELRTFFLEKMFIGTQLHEIGHTVGLRHNFSASTDALNYHDEYWKIQLAIAEGKIGPDDVYSIQGQELIREILGEDSGYEYLSETEFRIASVMDYTADNTGRFSGMGKYDQAAINFAYGEVVEQWKESVTLPNLLFYETWLDDYKALPRIFANQPGSGATTDPAVQIEGINNMLYGREYVPITQAITQRRNGIRANTANWHNGQLSRQNPPYIDRSVAYEFCSDDRRDYQLGCDVWDFGANQVEVVGHAFDTYRAMQPFWRNKRHGINRGYENYGSYINRVVGTFRTVERPFRYYSIYQWWDLGSYTDDLREASINALNFYGEVLATPNPGYFCPWLPQYANNLEDIEYIYDLENTYVPASWTSSRLNCDGVIKVDKGIGQYWGFQFTDEYDYRIERVGAQVDKSLASQLLFDIGANFLYSDFIDDARATNISFWTLFQDEFLDMLHGLIVGDFQGFAGVYNTAKGTYEPPYVVDPARFGTGLSSPQGGMKRVYSPLGFNQRFNSVVGAMFSATTWGDRVSDFGDYVKISVSDNERSDFADHIEVVEFVHPFSGKLYIAPQTPDGRSITVSLVEWANDLKDDYLATKQVLDNTPRGTAGYAGARKRHEDASQVMEEVVAKLDMMRFIWQAMGANAMR